MMSICNKVKSEIVALVDGSVGYPAWDATPLYIAYVKHLVAVMFKAGLHRLASGTAPP